MPRRKAPAVVGGAPLASGRFGPFCWFSSLGSVRIGWVSFCSFYRNLPVLIWLCFPPPHPPGIEEKEKDSHLERLLHLPRTRQHLPHILWEAELLQRLINVLRCDRLLRLTLRNLVSFGGDESDKFDAAVDEEVTGVAGEGDGGF